MLLAVLWLGGALLGAVEWTVAQGEPVKVSLLQGNIAQDEKFAEGQLIGTLETYRRLAQSSDARLIVFPETALPLLRSDLPESYTGILREHARQFGGDVLIGSFEKEGDSYYNTMFSVGASPSQTYHKNHMVPFGEYIPLRPVFGWLVNEVLNIPMSDQASGGAEQPLLHLAGQRIAMNICFEDVFGEEIIRALPQATLLLNTSNDAWYGESSAAMQHNQIAQMRALETGRMMLRATNTGVTSVIGSDGRILQMLPQHEEGVLTAEVQGYAGATPYVRWGNVAVVLILALMMFVVWRTQRKGIVSGE
jgi:apolipoprotein N-acyltransferase